MFVAWWRLVSRFYWNSVKILAGNVIDFWKNLLFCFILRADPRWKICKVSSTRCWVLIKLLCMSTVTIACLSSGHLMRKAWYRGIFFDITNALGIKGSLISASARMTLVVLILGLNCMVLMFKLWGKPSLSEIVSDIGIPVKLITYGPTAKQERLAYVRVFVVFPVNQNWRMKSALKIRMLWRCWDLLIKHRRLLYAATVKFMSMSPLLVEEACSECTWCGRYQ